MKNRNTGTPPLLLDDAAGETHSRSLDEQAALAASHSANNLRFYPLLGLKYQMKLPYRQVLLDRFTNSSCFQIIQHELAQQTPRDSCRFPIAASPSSVFKICGWECSRCKCEPCGFG